MRKTIILALLFCCGFSAYGQKSDSGISPEGLEQLQQLEDTLGVLGYAIVNDSLAENRFGACHQMIKTLVKALKTPNSFEYPFERMRAVSILYPQDSSFRIFTWQLYVDTEEYKYYGAIQMNSEELQLFPLQDRSAELTSLDYEVFGPERWYGALYYNIRTLNTPDGPQHLLFGFDGYSFFTKRKLIDVLTFQEGKPVFGAPIFTQGTEESGAIPKNRLVLEYTAETSIRLNYDENMGIIIFDHLISMMTPRGPVMVPDGSYEGFEIENGKLVHVEKLFHQVSETPPRPQPVLDSKGKRKDIFGNR
ncbi:MAG: hypothetical protein AAGG75_12550 [Bacteroidota bacterium]